MIKPTHFHLCWYQIVGLVQLKAGFTRVHLKRHELKLQVPGINQAVLCSTTPRSIFYIKNVLMESWQFYSVTAHIVWQRWNKWNYPRCLPSVITVQFERESHVIMCTALLRSWNSLNLSCKKTYALDASAFREDWCLSTLCSWIDFTDLCVHCRVIRLWECLLKQGAWIYSS